jgi:hypothetical protein
MVDQLGTVDEPLKAGEDLIVEIVSTMRSGNKCLLISVNRGEPGRALLDLPGANDLPAVRWKLETLANLSAKKRTQLLRGRIRHSAGRRSQSKDGCSKRLTKPPKLSHLE